MKCPHCGHWNKPSFPRCFQCGEPLNAKDAATPKWREQFEKPQPTKTKRIVYDDAAPQEEDLPAEEALPEKKDESLALEMNRLKDRRARGTLYLQEFRKHAAEEGIAPSGAGVSIRRSGGFFSDLPDDPEETLYEPPEIRKQLRNPPPRQRTAAAPKYEIQTNVYPQMDEELPDSYFDGDIPSAFDDAASLSPGQGRRRKRRRRAQGPVGVAIWFVRILAVVALTVGIWQVIPAIRNGAESPAAEEEAQVDIETIDVGGYPGRRVKIHGEEGSQVYISELTKSYVVVGGVATIEVADHVFYDTIANLESPQMEVSLTPTISRSGVDKRLAPIRYTIDIPLSQVQLISPEATYVNVSTSIYNMKLKVEPGSKVTVNGSDISDTVHDDGVVTLNPPVQAIGENIISITVRAPYCRENNLTVTLYREPQDIPLELAPDTTTSTDEDNMTIRASTMAGASITIETPIYSKDDAALEETGNFSFVAKMTRVGYNTIRMRASYPGKEDSVLEHVVYYLPRPEIYTVKAWALSASDYSELLNNIALRTNNAQIYLCRGEIIEILSDNPQLAIMNTGTADKEQLVLLQNESKTPWVKGTTYRVYADVNGLYNAMPKMIGRYTYDP